jgi:NADH-quinone oxidoreductase subunit N
MNALLILFFTALLALFVGLTKNRHLLQPITFFGTLGAFAVTVFELNGNDWSGLNNKYASMIQFDQFALAFTAITLCAVMLLVGLSSWGFRQLRETLGDNYGLILFSLCGALCMFSFTNLTMLFLGIEILSIPLYVLAGSKREDLASNEAALKYFIMGAFATAILLFGVALVYGATGSFDLQIIGKAVSGTVASKGMLNVGILMILIGLSFKVGAVPFHFWSPDVYQGSPNLVTAFMATVVKTAGFAAFYRLFSTAFVGASEFWSMALVMIAGMTMTVANFSAISQTSFKRMMAYSSISHAGYLMLAILAAGTGNNASGAMLLYLLTYSIATICAFACFMLVSEQNSDGEFSAFNGLGKKSPFIAAVMAICMLSLAGIPPTAGFFGKYFLFSSAFNQYPWLVVLAVINSAISIYYYFKIIVAMYFTNEENSYDIEVPAAYKWVMLVSLVLIVALTLMPGQIFSII